MRLEVGILHERNKWGQGSQATRGGGKGARRGGLGRQGHRIGHYLELARPCMWPSAQEEEMWNGVQSCSWVTKEHLASFSHEVGGDWVRELWCRAQGTTRTHLPTPQSGDVGREQPDPSRAKDQRSVLEEGVELDLCGPEGRARTMGKSLEANLSLF